MKDNWQTDSELQLHIDNAIEANESARKAQLRETIANLNGILELGDALRPEQIQDATNQHQEAVQQLETAINIDRPGYIELAAQQKFFGGDAEIYALSQQFGLRVEIGRQMGSNISYDYDLPINPGGADTLKLLFDGNKRHFDLIY